MKRHNLIRDENSRFIAVRQAEVAATNTASEIHGGEPHKVYHHNIAPIIDEAGKDAIFLHHGVSDAALYGLKAGKMWSRMKNAHNQLWEMVRHR